MAVQDLTPQLRTRLSKVERVVGWFVVLAVILFLVGFAYYVYQMGKRKGWFITTAPYYTYVADAAGLEEGNIVRMMGFDVGEIVEIEPTEAGNSWYNENQYNVFVKFEVHQPYYGYIWTDSRVKIVTGDLLGARVLEVTKGLEPGALPTVIDNEGVPVRILEEMATADNFDYVLLEDQPQGYWLKSDEQPALTARLDDIASQIENALPGFFQLTNEVAGALSGGAAVTTNINAMMTELRPVVTHLSLITGMLTNQNGGLGNWLIPTNLNEQLRETLATASSTMKSADSAVATAETNLTMLSTNLNMTLINLANITSNLNTQVQTNDAILHKISEAIVHADELMQGLKRHWLLRSAFDNDEEENGDDGGRSSQDPVGLPPRAGKPW